MQIDVALTVHFKSHFAGSTVCKATSTSVGVIGISWFANSAPMPSRRLKNSLTTIGFSLRNLGRAWMISCLERPLNTGIKMRTSLTLVWCRSLTMDTSWGVGACLSVRMWMILVTNVSFPLGHSSIRWRTLSLSAPRSFIDGSMERRIVRFCSDETVVYTLLRSVRRSVGKKG